MSVTAYIAVSLDGFIADSNDSVDWLESFPNPEQSDFGFARFMASIDAVVMGRRTFEKVLSYGIPWPYDKPVFVLSRSLSRVSEDLAGKAEILAGDPSDVVKTLADRRFTRLYVDGGQCIRDFLNAGLIDQMTITRLPILLGGGVPLFGALDRPIRFHHVETQILNDHLVMTRYSKPEYPGPSPTSRP